jgi:hypothetical protein
MAKHIPVARHLEQDYEASLSWKDDVFFFLLANWMTASFYKEGVVITVT